MSVAPPIGVRLKAKPESLAALYDRLRSSEQGLTSAQARAPGGSRSERSGVRQRMNEIVRGKRSDNPFQDVETD